MLIVFETETKRTGRQAAWADPIRDIQDGLEASPDPVKAVYVELVELAAMITRESVIDFARQIMGKDPAIDHPEPNVFIVELAGLPPIKGVYGLRV